MKSFVNGPSHITCTQIHVVIPFGVKSSRRIVVQFVYELCEFETHFPNKSHRAAVRIIAFKKPGWVQKGLFAT